jgi:hypothetical protein
MRLKLSDGQEVTVEVHYQDKEVKGGRGTSKATSLGVFWPDNKKAIVVSAVCDSRDQFSRKSGKLAAFRKLIRRDTDQAVEEVVQRVERSGRVSRLEAGSLNQAAKRHYWLSRKDRKIIFKAVCAEFGRNDPERKALREKLLYERLFHKFGPPEASTCPKKTVVHQKVDTFNIGHFGEPITDKRVFVGNKPGKRSVLTEKQGMQHK